MRFEVFALSVTLLALASAGCSRDASPSDRCEDVDDEEACRQCCQQAGAQGATWVDSECACLTPR
jgi:hypothetical protein